MDAPSSLMTGRWTVILSIVVVEEFDGLIHENSWYNLVPASACKAKGGTCVWYLHHGTYITFVMDCPKTEG